MLLATTVGLVVTAAIAGAVVAIQLRSSSGRMPVGTIPGTAAHGRSSDSSSRDETLSQGATSTGTVPATMTAAARSLPDGGVVTRDSGEDAGTFMVRVFWWDDTERSDLEDAVVTWGRTGSWRPDASVGSQAATMGPFPTGRRVELWVYTDGTGGKAAVVPLMIEPTMRSGSELDGVHIEVSDRGVRVLGNPVDNFEWSFLR